MVKKNSYQYLRNKYNDYIIIQQSGCFYDIRDEGAIFLSKKFGYKLYSDKVSEYKIGVPVSQLEKILDEIRKNNFKYIVSENYEIIEIYNNGISIIDKVLKNNSVNDISYVVNNAINENNYKFDRKQKYKKILDKIKNYILQKNSWVDIRDIEKFLELKRRGKIDEHDNLSTVAHLISSYLKKEGFKTKRITLETDYTIFVAPINVNDEELFVKDSNVIEVTTNTELSYREQTNIEPISNLKLDIDTVLGCIQEFDGKFSYKGIIKILTGYFGFKYIPIMNNSKYFGIYKDKTEIEISKILDSLIEHEIIVNDGKIKINKNDESFVQSRSSHEKMLNEIFGHDSFKDWQWNVIKKLLNRKKILSIEKTGGGKSLCFQYTAQYFYSIGKGVTIVFSPLQALMREQVRYLKSLGIKAECIISSKESIEEQDKEHKRIYNELINNNISILYIAPERLNNSIWMEYNSKFKIAMIVIDEAHCVSTWGHDFRIDYRRIIDLTKLLPPTIPVLALTATANNIVANDIKEQIGNDLQVIRGSLERKNLNLNVLKTNNLAEKYIYIKKFIESQEGHGIIYVGTRADTKIFSDWLNYIGIRADYYHAGLSDMRRREIEVSLKNNEYKAIVSTNALGMGMDKKDVRFVIHVQMPSSLIAYYQEIGRAGRDNEPSNILLLYNDDDEDLQKYFIETSKPSKKHYVQTLTNLKKTDLKLYNLTKIVNVRKATMQLILKDLEDKGHIKRLDDFRYTFLKNMSDEEYELINQYKEIRYEDLAKMLQYIHLETCRTRFICDYLNDNINKNCNHCDNCLSPLHIELDPKSYDLLQDFFDNYFIFEETTNCTIVSSGYYKIETVGELVKDSKYRNKGYFDDRLIDRVLRAYNKYYIDKNLDVILFIPPTVSGDLVENFANRLSLKINIPVRKDLIKIKETEIPLKEIQNKIKKRELLKGVFGLKNGDYYKGKRILLVDDIIDSGVTVDEVSKLLLQWGALEVCVLTIAKTTVGDE